MKKGKLQESSRTRNHRGANSSQRKGILTLVSSLRCFWRLRGWTGILTQGCVDDVAFCFVSGSSGGSQGRGAAEVPLERIENKRSPIKLFKLQKVVRFRSQQNCKQIRVTTFACWLSFGGGGISNVVQRLNPRTASVERFVMAVQSGGSIAHHKPRPLTIDVGGNVRVWQVQHKHAVSKVAFYFTK